MSIKKGIIYGNQKYFYRLLKYKFDNEFIFDSFKKVKEFKSLSKDYILVIFVIYTEAELEDLMKVYKNDIPLIVCSFNKNILNSLKNNENMLLVDTSKVRSEILLDLKTYFNFFTGNS